jgi:hypothetical protein
MFRVKGFYQPLVGVLAEVDPVVVPDQPLQRFGETPPTN